MIFYHAELLILSVAYKIAYIGNAGVIAILSVINAVYDDGYCSRCLVFAKVNNYAAVFISVFESCFKLAAVIKNDRDVFQTVVIVIKLFIFAIAVIDYESAHFCRLIAFERDLLALARAVNALCPTC